MGSVCQRASRGVDAVKSRYLGYIYAAVHMPGQ